MTGVAWWPHTSDLQVASVRLRCMQIVTELQRRGFQAKVYVPGQPAPKVLVLSKRYDEESIRHAITMRNSVGTRLILDLCDNHFYTANNEKKWKIRADTLRKAINEVDLVVASTPTLAQYIKEECPNLRQLTVIGDAVEEPLYPVFLKRLQSISAELQFAMFQRKIAQANIAYGRKLLWFGNHGSGNAPGGMEDLLMIRESLENLSVNNPLALTVISNSAEKYRNITKSWSIKTFYLNWHPVTFSRAAALHDIALIPVGRNPFTVCKTNNRIATALVHGLAVVADSIPSYQEFSESVILDNWESGITQLSENSIDRRSRIKKGTDLVQSRWTLSHIADQWARALGLHIHGAYKFN